MSVPPIESGIVLEAELAFANVAYNRLYQQVDERTQLLESLLRGQVAEKRYGRLIDAASLVLALRCPASLGTGRHIRVPALARRDDTISVVG